MSEMGLIIRCAKCGYTFYYSHSIKAIDTLLNPLPAKCPKCKKELIKDMDKITIKIIPKSR
jgi:predicted Zn-ribbon and HTH transcriptional regulator